MNEAVDLQIDAGLDVISDGEMRRYAFYGHFVDAVEGFDKYGGWAIPFRDERGDELVLKRPIVVSPLKRRRHLCAEEFTYLRAKTDHPAKATLINAQQAAAYYHPEQSKSAYPTIEPYLADVVDILRAEVDELVRLGCTYIQLDAPQYAALLDPEIREGNRRVCRGCGDGDFRDASHREQRRDAGPALRAGHDSSGRGLEHRARPPQRVPVSIGVGVHYGPVAVGDVGDRQHLAFAVVGDTVNVASRLQSLTRDLRVSLVVSKT